ncbi:hypothetical protein [Bradyrhizobium sp. 930_D9_N1_4]|uniref:hypothetical protein n=1 Tax=Bradyrhizobium sp. 930_D9_N1_4 TaxID=3240374 RepID=UPI003F8A6988
MPNIDPGVEHKRTAVLVVHGIGSQRALETVRGVIRGIWWDSNNPADNGKRLWTHPERNREDIDLSVMTTNEVPGSKDARGVDFHELYWAHLMSETKAVAVLLWLYELCRKGPIMRHGLNGLWWGAAIFLCMMNLSFALLALKGVLLFSQTSAQNILIAPSLILFSSLVIGFFGALLKGYLRLGIWLAVLCVIGIGLGAGYFWLEFAVPGDRNKGLLDGAELITLVALPTLDALLGTYLVMGRRGLLAFALTLAISVIVCGIFVWVDQYWYPARPLFETVVKSWPWALNSSWSAPIAFGILSIYLAVNGAFLQPYLGDAARYFRGSPANVAVRRAIRKEAVDTLEGLHDSGQYDRIIVVAHSLGCVVSYDMLRAYFSRVSDDLPPITLLGQEFLDIDGARWQPEAIATRDEKRELRIKARQVIANIADVTVKQPLEQRKFKSWLVTDYVTLGSALSHAYFLMCDEDKRFPDLDGRQRLRKDFDRRVSEREFPTCPPKRLDQDGLLSFDNKKKKARQIHNGALFGLTRWTNIYFPIEQIFWGDAIGGPLGPIFGRHIVDIPVSTKLAGGADFFTHTAYWDVERKPDIYKAPHIVALREAGDFAESGSAIDIIDRGVDAPDKDAGA